MTDAEFWAEVKSNLREAYASALHWQERAQVAREQGDSDRERERAYLLLMALTFQITEQQEQWRVGHACVF